MILRCLAPVAPLALLALAGCGGADGQGDLQAINAGEAVFETNCKSCHGFTGHQVGPKLKGVVDSPAASHPDFAYSDALANAGIVWTEARLIQYLTTANDIPGGNMVINPLSVEDARAVIAYLRFQAEA